MTAKEAQERAEQHSPPCPSCGALALMDEFGYWCRICYRPTRHNTNARLTPDIEGTAEQMHALHVYQALVTLQREFGKQRGE